MGKEGHELAVRMANDGTNGSQQVERVLRVVLCTMLAFLLKASNYFPEIKSRGKKIGISFSLDKVLINPFKIFTLLSVNSNFCILCPNFVIFLETSMSSEFSNILVYIAVNIL